MTTQVKKSQTCWICRENYVLNFSLLTNMVRMLYLYPKYILYTCIKYIGTIPGAQVYLSIQKTIACFRVVSERQTETNH